MIKKLPCGCEMWKEGNTFYIRPCSKTCEYYLYAINQSRERGNIIIWKKEK